MAAFRSIPLAFGMALLAQTAGAADLTVVRVNTFPTARSLPFYAGIAKGIFAKHGLKIELEFTENSRSQRDGLASGKIDIVHAAVDNAVAMADVGKQDIVIVTGGDSGTNEFYVQGYINTFADIRGHALVVDAPNTAYALQAKKILAQHGLKEGLDYTIKPVGNGSLRLKAMADDRNNAAAIMNLPFSLQAAELGMKSLGRTVDMLGRYQAGGAFVMRAWAGANTATLERYIAAYVESLRWVLSPANRAEAVAMLAEKLKLSSAMAAHTYDFIAEPSFGFAPDAKFDLDGFRNVLAPRPRSKAMAQARRRPNATSISAIMTGP